MPLDVPTDTGRKPIKCRTAFVVVQHENGEWEAVSDLSTAVNPEHTASVIEMKFGASEVVSDIEASKQAAITAHQLMAVTAQMQQAAQHQSLADRLKL
ncbi:hypothetical protein DMB38_19965 [Streptomyces sp. WAC 06738]|uniref:hypothetical protein n=1 Tax=Streptomyces sp. WAC 06738 TaxID=2203210 RepID=UPI000F6E3FB2|nr:hypothetical protein [Streptomyces sp. WAC 06738]AZM47754.1 hypothetical protein DMB38_19965 [Streptomyces sp. WAC 06738]